MSDNDLFLDLSFHSVTIPKRRSKRLIAMEKKTLFIYYDFETTGLNPYHSNLLECAFLISSPTSPTTPIATITSLVQYKGTIPSIVKKITHITELDVVDAPPLQSVIAELVTQVYALSPYRVVWIAHNNYGFDQYFWNRYFAKHLDFCQHLHLDTMRLAQLLVPFQTSYSLLSVASLLQVPLPEGNAHRAQYDTQVLHGCFVVLSERYQMAYQVNLFDQPEHGYCQSTITSTPPTHTWV